MTKFSDFMKEVAREAEVEGPAATAELRSFRERSRSARRISARRRAAASRGGRR